MNNKDYKFDSIMTVALDVTYKCNLKCLHCFNSSGEHNFSYTELLDEEIFDVVKQVCEIKNLKSICFCGGETLLRKDILLKCAKYIRKISSKLSINIVTNGQLMTRELAKDLKDCGFSFVQVSLDGSNSDTHDWLRNKKGAFNKAVNAIKYLVEAGLTVGVACTPTKRNIDEIDEIIKLCKSLGVKMFRMQRIMGLGRANINLTNEFPSYMDYRKVAKTIQKNIDYDDNFLIEWGDPLNHLISGRSKETKLEYIGINAYGYIYATPYLPITFGNIRNGSLMQYLQNGLLDVWSSRFLKKVSSIISSELDLDVSKKTNLPKIFSGNDIEIDLLHESILESDERLLNKYIV